MNFVLRPWEISDLDSLVIDTNNANIAKFLTDMFPHPYTVFDAKAYIEMVGRNDPQCVFAIVIDGEAAESIGR